MSDDEKQRQMKELAKMRELSQEAAAGLGDDVADNLPVPVQSALQSAQKAEPVHTLGTAATLEWKGIAQEEFNRLRRAKDGYPHTQKMIDTIVALVDARLAGLPETPVFDRPDTCAAGTYHVKWKHDPDFAQCLETVTKLAQEWHDGRALRALETAAERLALASPGAVAKLTEALVHSGDWNVMVRSAVAILDRAGVQTAMKQSGEMQALLTKVLEKLDFTKLSDEQLRRVRNGENPLKVILDDYVAD